MNSKKDCMFQYASKQKIFNNTSLITRDEAEFLFEKHLFDIKARWNDYESPEMCIWINCLNDNDYSEKIKHIKYESCELINGHFYKVEKTIIV